MPQEKMIKALLYPKAYPYKVRKIKLIQTYISWVLLTGKYVYKIKKPVKYSHLNFSTLKRREFFCKRELRLNRRICPEVYLDVVPITKKGKKIQIGGQGRVIDWAIKMKQLQPKWALDYLAIKKKVTKPKIDKIAKIIAQFHSQARTSSYIKRFGALKVVKKNWRENFSQTKDFVDQTISKPIFNFIRNKVNEYFIKNRTLFKKRISQGKIKDCHGDLLASDIYVLPKKIYITDCIEFNRRFRYQDTASDIAFLAMDLDFLDRSDLSDYLVKRYITYTKDKELTKLLSFYKCYRAYVRGKVYSFNTRDLSISKEEREKFEEKAQAHFALAFRYAHQFSKSKPFLLIMCGPVGSGKSWLATHLARVALAQHIRSDLVRKELLGIKPFEYRKKGLRKIYAKQVTDRVYREIIKRARKLLKDGQPVILDATFGKQYHRDLAFKMAKSMKIPYWLIECFTPEKTILKFLRKRKKLKEISDADIKVYLKTKKEFEPPKIPKEHYIKVNTPKGIIWCVNKVLDKVLKI